MSPFVILVLALLAAGAGYVIYNIWNTKRNGIETAAVVTDITEETTVNSDGASTSWTFHVRYTTADGVQQDARITNIGFSKGPEIGERITIRYLPEKPKKVVWIR